MARAAQLISAIAIVLAIVAIYLPEYPRGYCCGYVAGTLVHTFRIGAAWNLFLCDPIVVGGEFENGYFSEFSNTRGAIPAPPAP